jgi:hypothetical protein
MCFELPKRTVTHGILYSQKNYGECVGYSDADWAGDVKDGKFSVLSNLAKPSSQQA